MYVIVFVIIALNYVMLKLKYCHVKQLETLLHPLGKCECRLHTCISTGTLSHGLNLTHHAMGSVGGEEQCVA